MATLFMDISGIIGDATAMGFIDQIEIDSAYFGMHRTIRSALETDEDRESSTPYVGELKFTKTECSASPMLMSRHNKAISCPTAKLSFARTASGGEAYRVVTFVNAIITQVHLESEAGDAEPKEYYSMNFTEIHITDTTTTDGGVNGKTSTASFNLGAAQAT